MVKEQYPQNHRVGERIEAAMARERLTRAGLARMMGCNSNTVYSAMQGVVPAAVVRYVCMARALETSVEELVGDMDGSHPAPWTMRSK